MNTTARLTPASQKLLREIARHDRGEGVRARYLSRGRYYLDSITSGAGAYNRASFYPLFEQGLASGWDSENDPVRITDAGRQLATQLDADAAAKNARPKPKPNAESLSAQQALRALSELPQPVLPHRGHRRGMWSLGSRDGYTARELTFYALEDAGYVRMIRGAYMSTHIEITEAGRARLAAGGAS